MYRWPHFNIFEVGILEKDRKDGDRQKEDGKYNEQDILGKDESEKGSEEGSKHFGEHGKRE